MHDDAVSNTSAKNTKQTRQTLVICLGSFPVWPWTWIEVSFSWTASRESEQQKTIQIFSPLCKITAESDVLLLRVLVSLWLNVKRGHERKQMTLFESLKVFMLNTEALSDDSKQRLCFFIAHHCTLSMTKSMAVSNHKSFKNVIFRTPEGEKQCWQVIF